MEHTFVMVKPDGVQRGFIGEIINRFEKKGINIVGLKLMQIPTAMAEKHYGEHKDKPFFKELVDFITSGPVAAMVLEGKNVVPIARTMMGATNPKEAAPGTIRGDYAMVISNNIIHGSDSPESAEREINLFFNDNEIIDYEKATEHWIYG